MRSKLVRIGNSLGVRLPKQALARAGFAAERPVSIRVARGRITIVADANDPAVVVQSDLFNATHASVTVCP